MDIPPFILILMEFELFLVYNCNRKCCCKHSYTWHLMTISLEYWSGSGLAGRKVCWCSVFVNITKMVSKRGCSNVYTYTFNIRQFSCSSPSSTLSIFGLLHVSYSGVCVVVLHWLDFCMFVWFWNWVIACTQ